MKPRLIPTLCVSRATLLATGLGLAVSHGADRFKANNTDALNLPTSWDTTPGSGDVAVWNNTVTAANTTLLGADTTWSGVRVANPTGLVTINAGNALTLGSAGIDMSAATQNLTLANGVTLGAAQGWNVASGRTLTVSGALTGSGLVKKGIGTLVLGGNNASWASGFTVSEGKAQMASGAASAFGSGEIILGDANSGTSAIALSLQPTTTFLSKVTVANAGGGTTIWGSPNTTTAQITELALQKAVTLRSGESASSGGTIDIRTGVITGTGAGAGNDSIIIDARNSSGQAGTLRHSITDTGPANSFSGNVRITFGTWQMQNRSYAAGGNVLANQNLMVPDSSSVTVDSGAVWRFVHGIETIDALNGGGTINNAGGSYLDTANNGHFTVGAAGGSGNFGGVISSMAMRKIGAGTQTLSGSADNGGASVILEAGTVVLGKASSASVHAVGSGAATIKGGTLQLGGTGGDQIYLNGDLTVTAGTFDLNGLSEGIDNLSGAGGTVLNNVVGTTSLLTIGQGDNGGAGTYSGVLANGAGTLAVTKVGTGTTTLNGANTFTGPLTVNAGTIALGATGSIATPQVAVNAGATINGTATSGLLIADGKTLSGEGAVTGGLKLGTATGAILSINAATSGALAVTGDVTLTGTNVLQIPSLAPGSATVLTYTGALGGSGSFSAAASGTRTAPVINTAVAGTVTITHVAGPSITWTGSAGGTWDLSGASWDNSGASAFYNLDSVTFPQTAGTYDITIPAGTVVSPNAINFTNTSGTYTIGGEGAIGGSTGLNLTGGGTVVLNTVNTFLGKTIIDGSTLMIGNEAALGVNPPALVADQLTLQNGGAIGSSASFTMDDSNRGITLGSGGGRFVPAVDTTMTVNRPMAGTGGLTMAGAGTLALNYTSGTIATPLQIDSGTLALKYDGGAVTYSGPITGSAGIMRLEGTGASATTGLTLTGSNSFTGQTHIYGRRIFLANPSGNAIGGDIVFKQSNWPYHDLTLSLNEQIADTAVLWWEQPAGQDVYEFRLNGKTETVAGLVASTTTPAIIENAGYDGGNDNNIPAGKLIVSPPTGADYYFVGSLRNQNGGTGNGALSFEKTGAGTQTLSGGFSYTGTTTVSGGKLVLEDPSNATTTFASSGVTVAAGAELELKRTTGATWLTSVPISGAGKVTKTGSAALTLAGTQTYTGATTVADGTLSITGTLASPVIDVQAFGILSGATIGTGTTVKGDGTLVGVTFTSGSTLAPGTDASSIAMMLGDGTITFAANSTAAMEVNRSGGSITNDSLVGMDAIVYGGTLTVTATGQAFQTGDVISLFPGALSYGGGFTTTNLPALTGSLSWDLSRLTIDGSIQVVGSSPTPVFNPPAGGYVGAQTVSISSASGTTIHYTMDGSTPTISSPSGPSPITGIIIPTNSNITIKAFARKTGQSNSPVATAEYRTIDFPLWTFDGTGSWQDAINWQSGVLAQGAGVTADFSTLTTTGANEVWLDGPRTVGQLVFGDQGNQFGWTLSSGNGGSLILNNGANAPVVNVINQSATLSTAVTSSNGLRKTGAGTLSLTEANAISGAITIEGGNLNVGNANAITDGTAVTLGVTGSVDPTLTVGIGANKTFGALTVPAGVNGAAFAMTQNTNTFNQTVAGATLGSPLKVVQRNTTGINWSQVIWTQKITGNGGGSGNDTLVFDNTASTQNYFTMSAGLVNDFTGNVRVKAGLIAVQSGSAGSNFMIPDASMLIIESGQWRWNQTGFVETIDGLAGAGSMTNPQNATLTIDASNADNHGDRSFTGTLGTMAGTLTKKGSGTQSLGGANITYTSATTIDAGTLELNETTAFASSPVTVNGGKLVVSNTTGTGTGTTATINVKTGATLAGGATGSVSGTTTIEAGATIAPGDAGIGTLGANNLSLAGTYACQLGATAGDALNVAGTLTILPGAAITVSTVGTPTAASYTILTYGTLSGTLPVITGVPSGYSVDTSTPGVVRLTTGDAYGSWIDSFTSLTNPADKTMTADPDRDGLANVLEFVLNSDPTKNALTNLPTITSSGTNLVFTYTRRDDSESLSQAVEFDADMAGVWTTAVNGTNCTIVVTENDANPDTVTVTIPKQANTKLFVRLKVNP